MIYFVADRVGGTNGGDQFADDILNCLRLTGRALTVLSAEAPSRQPPPGKPGEGRAPPETWLTRPRYVAFPKRADRLFFKRLAKWLLWNAQDSGLKRRLRKHLGGHGPELVLFNDFPHPESDIHKQFSGYKTAVLVNMTPDGVEFFRQSTDPSYTALWAVSTVAAFDAQIFNTAAARSEWLAKVPLPLNKTHVLWCSCREEVVRALLVQTKADVRRQVGLAADDYVAVCVGNLRPGKGQDLLIDALPALVGAIPNFRLVLVGSDAGPWPGTLRRRVAELGLAGCVTFTGVVENALAFTYAADVFVYPTRAESQGIAVLEAMALKTPVVATRVGGVPESVVHGESALLVPGDDAARLAEAVIRLYTDAGLGGQLVQNASERYWQNFARAHQVRRFGELVVSLLAS